MAVAQVTIAGISRENLEAEGVILRSDQNLIVILSGPDLTPDRPYQRLGVHAAGIGYHFTGGECDGVIIVASGDAPDPFTRAADGGVVSMVAPALSIPMVRISICLTLDVHDVE